MDEKAGIVYILTNEAMPGYIKIGKTTTSVDQRVLELSRSTSVPLPFECYYAVRVADVSQVEKALHDAFGDHRKNPKREFFTIAPERIVSILKVLISFTLQIKFDFVKYAILHSCFKSTSSNVLTRRTISGRRVTWIVGFMSTIMPKVGRTTPKYAGQLCCGIVNLLQR